MWHSRFALLAALCIASSSASPAHVLINVNAEVLTAYSTWLGPGMTPASLSISFVVDSKEMTSRIMNFANYGTPPSGVRLDFYDFKGVVVPWVSILADGREISGKSEGWTARFRGDNPSSYTGVGVYFAGLTLTSPDGQSFGQSYDALPAMTGGEAAVNDDPLANLLLRDVYLTAIYGGVRGAYGELTYSGVTMQATSVPTVSIDIKPGNSPNEINLKSDGLIPVAILGSSTFNVAQVQVDSVRFAGAKSEKFKYEDVNGDGFFDLLLRFPVQELGLTSCSIQGVLVGKFSTGTLFLGTDSVVIKGKDGKDKNCPAC